jgi:hypothetical protein
MMMNLFLRNTKTFHIFSKPSPDIQKAIDAAIANWVYASGIPFSATEQDHLNDLDCETIPSRAGRSGGLLNQRYKEINHHWANCGTDELNYVEEQSFIC